MKMNFTSVYLGNSSYTSTKNDKEYTSATFVDEEGNPFKLNCPEPKKIHGLEQYKPYEVNVEVSTYQGKTFFNLLDIVSV